MVYGFVQVSPVSARARSLLKRQIEAAESMNFYHNPRCFVIEVIALACRGTMLVNVLVCDPSLPTGCRFVCS